jgi:L-asparaginase II
MAVVERNGRIESEHHGLAVALNPDGSVARSWGDPNIPIYARSAFKPIQAQALIELGLEVTGEQLALVCASHDGSPRHLEVVTSLLAAAGLDHSDLRTPEDLPLDRHAAEALLAQGGSRSRLAMNCSGKHAGMLATCVQCDWPTQNYLNVDHPVQRHILDAIATRCGGHIDHVGVDGCGAPAPMVPLLGLVTAVAQIASDRGQVHAAMTSLPDLVAGPQRAATILMGAVGELIAKDGAEGVFVAAVPGGPAVGVKIADGATRASALVAVALLRDLAVPIPEDLDELVSPPVLGAGQRVGRVRVVI